jgi:hypothetical protein
MAASAWGSLGWNVGTFGGENDVTVILTGQSLTSVINSVVISADSNTNTTGEFLTSTINGVTIRIDNETTLTSNLLSTTLESVDVGPDANLTGQQLTAVVGSVEASNAQGWGRLTWGSLTWGGDVQDIVVSLSGQQLTTDLNSVSITGTAIVFATGEQLTSALGNVDPAPDVALVGQELSAEVDGVGVSAGGNVSVPIFEAPLVLVLGTYNIIGTGNVSLTGQQLSTSLNSVSIDISIDVAVTGQNLNTAQNSVSITGTANIPVVGRELFTALGSVDPAPDVELTGQQLTTNIGTAIAFTDVLVSVTGIQITSSLNSVSIDLNTPVNVTGQGLTLALNSVTAIIDNTVNVSGNNLTARVGQVYVTAWQIVDTGQNINWTPVDTAA